MPASYPSSAKSFTSKSNGQTVDAGHINDLQLEVTAIENDLIAGVPVSRGGTGNLTLTQHGVLIGAGTSAVAVSSTGVTGQVFMATSGSAPSFQAIEQENTIVVMQVFS